MTRNKHKRRSNPGVVATNYKGGKVSIADLVRRNITTGRLPQVKPSIPLIIRDEAEEKRLAAIASEWHLEQSRIQQKPWFHCFKQRRKYSEDILITPEMAQLALQYNSGNRKQSENSIDVYRRDILNDNFMTTHESIAFDIAGNLIDGQHRLEAIVQANKSLIVYVTFNCPIESRYVINIGQKRSDAQQMKFLNKDVNSKTTSIARSMMRGVTTGKPKYSITEIAEFVYKYNNVIDSAFKMVKGSQRSDTYAAFAKAILWFGEDKVKEFAERFSSNTFNDIDDPARVLWTYLNGKKYGRGFTPPEEIYRKSLSAIEAGIEGRKLKKLIGRGNDFFNWEANWEVPK